MSQTAHQDVLTVPGRPRGGTETILVVEDETAILRMIRMMLETLGYTVLPAATPGAALELAKHHRKKLTSEPGISSSSRPLLTGIRPRMARPVVLFPDPDSPTRPVPKSMSVRSSKSTSAPCFFALAAAAHPAQPPPITIAFIVFFSIRIFQKTGRY
jgi:CheY-like chemotaxis protein